MKIIKAVPFNSYHFVDYHLSFIDKLFIKPRYEQYEQLGSNKRMFDEDFARIFLRPLSRRNGKLFNIESNNDALAQKLFGNIKKRYDSHHIDETVRELVEQIAQSLICFGSAYYFLHDTFDQEEIYIESFRPIGVFRFFKMYFQWVPRRSERYSDSDGKVLCRELRILDKAKLMRFNMPKSINRILYKQNRLLVALDKHAFDASGFLPQTTRENPNPKNDFDFRIWRDTQDQLLYRATHATGWNGRKYDSSKRSDFFDCHRLIRFRRNQLILRDHILHQLGNEFTRVGRQYDAKFHVAISTTNVLPKVSELDDLEAQLSKEEISFNEALNFCFER